jgi:hypothetical protein
MRTSSPLARIVPLTVLGLAVALAACERPAAPPPAATPAPDVAAEPAPAEPAPESLLEPADALSKTPIDVVAMKWNGKWVPVGLHGGECLPGELPIDHRTCRKPGQLIRWQVYDVFNLRTRDDVDIEIRFKDAGNPLEDEDLNARCLGKQNKGILKCKVKLDAVGEYRYSIILDGGELDPRIVVNPDL